MAVIFVDCSEVTRALENLHDRISAENITKIMDRCIRDTARHAKSLVVKDVRKEYSPQARWVRPQIKPPVIGGGGLEVGAGGMKIGASAIIPVQGMRAVIGSTAAPIKGRTSKKAMARKKIQFQILKAAQSQLPPYMSHQGGQPPFLNYGIRGSNGRPLVFTRKGKSRLPIARVSSLAVASMAVNRSAEEIKKDLSEYMVKRATHYIDRALQGNL